MGVTKVARRAIAESWPQFSSNGANTGYVPDYTGPQRVIGWRWRFDAEASDSSPAVSVIDLPAVDNGVFVGSGDPLVALRDVLSEVFSRKPIDRDGRNRVRQMRD